MKDLRNKICSLLLQLVVKISNYQTKHWEIKTDGCFRTYMGVTFNLLNPDPGMIHIRDIAKGLAYKPHFSGFSPQFFSIAEHSLLVQKFIADYYPDDYSLQLEALLHDASEAYTGDMIKPLKNLLPNFVVIEKRIQKVIYKKYGIYPKGVKPADNDAQDVEASVFYYGGASYSDHIRYLSPDAAYSDFLNKYNYLIYKLKGE